MRYFVIILFILVFFPANVLCQNKEFQSDNSFLSNIDADKYKSFLIEMRKSDIKREFADYKEDRDTRYRKLRESIAFEEREARIANQRAWEGRYSEAWDSRMSYINRGFSAQSDTESGRAFKAADMLRPPSRTRSDTYRR